MVTNTQYLHVSFDEALSYFIAKKIESFHWLFHIGKCIRQWFDSYIDLIQYILDIFQAQDLS